MVVSDLSGSPGADESIDTGTSQTADESIDTEICND